jgi:hypothetical protein
MEPFRPVVGATPDRLQDKTLGRQAQQSLPLHSHAFGFG